MGCRSRRTSAVRSRINCWPVFPSDRIDKPRLSNTSGPSLPEAVALPIAKKRPAGIRALMDWLGVHRPDVVSTHSSTDAWLTALSLLVMGRPFPMVRTRHDSAPVPRNPATRWLHVRAAGRIVTAGEILKRELVEGLDILILRELTGGTYFGEPKEIVTLENGEKRAVDTQVYTTHEIERITRVAFDLARTRGKKVHSAEKNNVMKTGVLWKEVVIETHKKHGAGIELHHILADNCAMQLIRNPKQFDVIVTDNLFGDILSDAAAMMTGSLGMLPSASLGAPDKNGQRKAFYEPVHGSAPDIAGQGKANPIATIASFGMALRYSFGLVKEADMVDKAISNALAQGYRTGDIMQPNMRSVGTTEMAKAILGELERLVA